MKQMSDYADESIVAESSGRAIPEHLKRRETDKYSLLAQGLFFGGLSYGAMVLYAYGILPLWGLIAANIMFYIRAYSRMHDLCHAFPTNTWAVRYLPTLFYANPVWGGTTAFITTHVDHHKYLGTDRDPWLRYYAGHPLQALAFNMIEPEWNLYNYIKLRGVSRKFAHNLAFDVLFQVVNLMVFQGAYVVHLVIQRTWHGIGIFLFNWYPHRLNWSADAPIGNFNREKEVQRLAAFIRPIFGKPLLEAAYYHNRHHIIGQVHVPSHKYALCSDDGEVTRFTKQWPVKSVQHLAMDPQHAA